MTYHHLSAEERAVIMIEYRRATSVTQIARLLGRHRSTIGRELNRHPSSEAYDATVAARSYRENRQRCVKPKKLTEGTPLFATVHNMLRYRQWSPEQMANKLKQDYPDEPSMHVCAETIYAAIYAFPRNELKKVFIQELRQAKPKRGNRRSAKTSATIQVEPEQTIHHRPEEVEERQVAGHWEGDLIVGAMNQSCIGTLVERKTGFVILSKMNSKSAIDVRTGFERQMKRIDPFLRLSMTYDRGSEMAEHPLMSKHLNLKIYFADPHSPWQRGSNENINGLLRQYLPKGTDLSIHSQEYLNSIAWLLNTRPRKRFNWQSPQDKWDQVIADHLNSVALAN